MLPYDPLADRIVSMAQVLKDYQSSFDMVKAAEMHYERMRTLNKTTLIQLNIKKSIGNIAAGISPESAFENPKQAAIESAIRELRTTILARGVGPLEEIPVGDYIQDSVRAKNVITHTQVGPEQRYLAKLLQQRGWRKGGGLGTIQNQWTEDKPAPGGGDVMTYVDLSDDGKLLKKEIPTENVASSAEQLAAKYNATLAMTREIVEPVGDPHGSTENKTFKNVWSVGKPYNAANALVKVSTEKFDFAIKNLANGRTVAFPAHITSFNEGASASWNNISLINRSEDIYVYQRAERTFNLEFVIFASVEDLDVDETEENEGTLYENTITIDGREVGVLDKKRMWNRINFLHTCTRPEYNEVGRFNKAPYCILYLGDVFHGITTIIESVNINYNPLIWDLNVVDKFGGVAPMVAEITLSGKLLHKKAPDAYYKFYGMVE